MSGQEVDRLSVVRKLEAKRFRQREAAGQLGLSVRQVNRHKGNRRGSAQCGYPNSRVSSAALIYNNPTTPYSCCQVVQRMGSTSVRATTAERVERIAEIVCRGLSHDDIAMIRRKRLLRLLGEMDDDEFLLLNAYVPIPAKVTNCSAAKLPFVPGKVTGDLRSERTVVMTAQSVGQDDEAGLVMPQDCYAILLLFAAANVLATGNFVFVLDAHGCGILFAGTAAGLVWPRILAGVASLWLECPGKPGSIQ